MGSKKLVWCCIAGIILGYFAPMVFGCTRSTSLSVGMVGGLALGYLLDMLDEKKTKNAGSETLTEKAREANLLMERARAEVEGSPVQEPDQEPAENNTADETESAGELTDEEQAAKLNEAEEMLRKARERIK